VIDRMLDEFRRPGRLQGAGFYEYEDGARMGLWSGLREAFPPVTDPAALPRQVWAGSWSTIGFMASLIHPKEPARPGIGSTPADENTAKATYTYPPGNPSLPQASICCDARTDFGPGITTRNGRG